LLILVSALIASKKGYLNARKDPTSLDDAKALNDEHRHLRVKKIKETFEHEPSGTIDA
tara:strand:- start:817 stop:990 length:174 start_codon:yes stop_codon:yes gene_type:complete